MTLASSFTDSRNASIITGIATFSSNSEPMPPRPAVVTTASLPITRQATWIADSQMTGFTLPGMIERAGLRGGQRQLEDAAPRAGAEQADVVGDFRERDGDRLQLAVGFDERILGRLGFGVIGGFGEMCRRVRLRERGAHFGRELGMRVDARADGRAADRHVFFEPLERPAGADRRRSRPGPRSRRTPGRRGSAWRPSDACGRF